MTNKNVPGNGFLVRLTHLREQNETIRGYNSYTRNCPEQIILPLLYKIQKLLVFSLRTQLNCVALVLIYIIKTYPL